MIAYVKGTLEVIGEDYAILDVGGVGFQVFTPINEDLLRVGIGNEVKLHTYMNVREDAMILYGFMDTDSLKMFEMLIGVTGVGPRSALGMLSSMDVTQLSLAIARDDKKALTKIPGIGAKTAARIVLDLKDKVSFAASNTPEVSMDLTPQAAHTGPAAEAVMALVSLGYSESEAKRAVSKVASSDMTVEEILRRSLKELY